MLSLTPLKMRSLSYNRIEFQLFPASYNGHLDIRTGSKFGNGVDGLSWVDDVLTLDFGYYIAGIDTGDVSRTAL